ncbi:60S ribosomal protein L28 [Phaffia rhodozyma]|uniref:60S ribosomal protein L28 n=1 Tax=Phaffia rhodozyma TaxID=264483 RepID=A0A0F7SGH5_PHARH|nr:60S ribosomal protein L28 [Phaffia rhodozyma]
MSQDLQWLLIRKSNSFLVKRTAEGPIFSKEPGNLRGLHSFKHSGLVNNKTVFVAPTTETSGLTLTTRVKGANPRHVKKALVSRQIKGNSSARRVAKIIAVETAARGYRPDLRTAALARASAITAAQKEATNPTAVREKKVRGNKAAPVEASA